MNNKTPTRANVIVLKQILNLIPREMINRHARDTGLDTRLAATVLIHLSAMLTPTR